MKPMMGFLSIVIPTFNRGGMLREALDSIIAQPTDKIEVLVMDDASTDDTKAVCAEFEHKANAKGLGFRFIQSPVHRGAPFLRNEGFRQSSGDFVMFMDSDDVLEGNVIHRMLSCFLGESLDFVYGKVKLVDANLNPLPGEAVGVPYIRGGYDLAGYHWQTMGAIYSRKLVEQVGPWNEELTGSQDWEFQARVKMAAEKWRFIDIFIGSWRQHDGSRIGTSSFRLDYVRSSSKACRLIRNAAKRLNLLDQSLKSRLGYRLLINAADLEVNGFPEDRRIFASEAFELFPKNLLNSSLSWILTNFPSLGSKACLFAFSLARRLRGKPRLVCNTESPHEACVSSHQRTTRISIMITSRNRREDLLRTCKVLQRLDPPPIEVLITADGCTDDSAELVKEEMPNAVLIINEISKGSIASRVQMMKIARGDLVLSLDDDSYPEQLDCLTYMAEIFENNPRLAVATFPQRTDEYPETLTQTEFGTIRPIRNFPNSGACYRMDTYRQLAGFESIFFHVYEETDYALQCFANDWEIVIFPKLTIRHHFTSVARNEIRNHHRQARNELWGTLIRCPFPQAFGMIIYRIFSQGFCAAKRGPGWLVREPVWWWQAIVGSLNALRLRRPVSWKGYMKWLSVPD